MIFSSCIEQSDYRKQENLDLLMSKTIDYSDHLNNKDAYGANNSLLGLNFKINKTIISKKKSAVYYSVSIPHNLRGAELELFLESFSDKFKKKYKELSIDIKHVGIENISGVVAKYKAISRDNSVKIDIEFIDYISKENLQKKGVKHYILEYDFDILVYISKEMHTNKNLSLKSAAIRVANKKKMNIKTVNNILVFARKYYSKK